MNRRTLLSLSAGSSVSLVAGCITFAAGSREPEGCPQYDGTTNHVCGRVSDDTAPATLASATADVFRDVTLPVTLEVISGPIEIDPGAYELFEWERDHRMWRSRKRDDGTRTDAIELETGETYQWHLAFGVWGDRILEDGRTTWLPLAPHQPQLENAFAIPVWEPDREQPVSYAIRFSRATYDQRS